MSLIVILGVLPCSISVWCYGVINIKHKVSERTSGRERHWGGLVWYSAVAYTQRVPPWEPLENLCWYNSEVHCFFCLGNGLHDLGLSSKMELFASGLQSRTPVSFWKPDRGTEFISRSFLDIPEYVIIIDTTFELGGITHSKRDPG